MDAGARPSYSGAVRSRQLFGRCQEDIMKRAVVAVAVTQLLSLLAALALLFVGVVLAPI